jgi:cell wall assembly regulator SMI1
MLMAPDIYGKVGDVITKLWNSDMTPEVAQNQLVAAINSK